MRFGIFCSMQIPRPWAEDSELRAYDEALEQVELADRLGFDYAWAVEHHFLEEYSHSAAPELFLAAASQRTERIRLGHGIVQMPSAVNHPVRVAERVAVLDLLSHGRAEFGTGEGTGSVELGGFGVDPATKRAQWRESVQAAAGMFDQTPFPGFDGEWVQIPERNVVPKPLQKPHPPLWLAAPRLESALIAAEGGMGALCFSLNVEPEEAAAWVREYESVIASERCVPVGGVVNPRMAFVLPMHCHADEEVAIARSLEGAHFYAYALFYYLMDGATHRHGAANVWRDFAEERARSYDPARIHPDDGCLRASFDPHDKYTIRGAIGDPEQLVALIRAYEAAGCDQLAFLVQAGRTEHRHVCESLELFGREVMPEFAARDASRQAERSARLAAAIDQALDRRDARVAVR